MKCLPVCIVRSLMLAMGTIVLTPVWAAQEVRVGAAHFPPYTVRPECGVDTGLLPQLLEALNQLQSDFHFVITPTSNARRFREFAQGRVDMVLFENPAWGWQGIAHDRVDMGLQDAEVFVAKRQPERQQSYFDDIASKRLALFNGYHYAFAGFNASPQYLSTAFQAILTYSHESNLMMVVRGRVDIALITRSHLADLLQHNAQAKGQVMVSDRTDYIYRHAALLRPHGPITPQAFAQMMEALRENGRLTEIFAPYNVAVVAQEPVREAVVP